MLLVIHLFFYDGEKSITQALRFVKDHNAQVPAGILLFALTYSLGSAVSRIAEDFFNDDDLHVRLDDGYLFRNVLTEDRILAGVYCDGDKHDLLFAAEGHSALGQKIHDLQKQPLLCSLTMAWRVAHEHVTKDEKKQDQVISPEGRNDGDFVRTARDIFRLQENALMNKGEDYTPRLRELHDQVMVLRGAAFNGWIAFSLCLFAWLPVLGDKLGSCVLRPHSKSTTDHRSSSDQKARSVLRLGFIPAPGFYLALVVIALRHHLAEASPQFPLQPPYMEFALLLLGLFGLWLLWKPLPNSKHLSAKKLEAQESKVQKSETHVSADHGPEIEESEVHHSEVKKNTFEEKQNIFLKRENLPQMVALSLVLTLAAGLGWWSTEVLYGEQVIYSYDTQVVAAAQK